MPGEIGEDGKVIEGQQDVKVLQETVAKLQSDFKNVVGEVTQMRKDKSTLEAERDALALKLKEAQEGGASGDKPDVAAEIQKAFQAKEAEQAKLNRASAEAKFKNANKEFSEDNDPGGIKFAALTAKLGLFALGSLKTEEEFKQVYESAYTLLNPARKPMNGTDYNIYANTPPAGGGAPKESHDNQLSAQERKIIERLGWTAEKYLKIKASRPQYVKELLEYAD